MKDVSLVPCGSYEPECCRRALLEALRPFGYPERIQPGTRVVIKANLVTALRPDRAATTHPTLLAQLTAILRERGASVVIGDSPGGLYNAAFLEPVYRATGLSEAEQAGAELNRDFSQKTADFPEGAAARSFPYTAYLDNCDLLIDFCKLKTHGMMGMSAAVKNLFGAIPGTRKPEFHFQYPDPQDFGSMLVDLSEYFHPALCLVDAVVAMEGNGPTAGTPRPMGLLLAAESPHRADLVCADLIGLSPEEVPTLAAAQRRGLIPAKVSDLSLDGDPSLYRIPDFQLVTDRHSLEFSGSAGAFGRLRSRLIRGLIGSRPQVSPAACIGCRKCESVCPARAISMQHNLPIIDRKRCIRCFCCQEFCPKGAMRVSRPPIARILNRN